MPAPRSEGRRPALAVTTEIGERKKKGSRQAGSPAIFEFSWRDPSATIAGESDLRQFLRVACPHWLCPRPGGGNDINRVVEKLRAIGVFDTAQLATRVTSGRINDDLVEAGYSRFSHYTIDAIRRRCPFLRVMESLTEVNFRQTGGFAHVPQLLSQTNLRQRELQRIKGSLDSVRPPSPMSPDTGWGPAEQMVQHLSTTSAASRAQSEGQLRLDPPDSPTSRASLRGAARGPPRRQSSAAFSTSSLPALSAAAPTPTARSREITDRRREGPGQSADWPFARASAPAGEVFRGTPSSARGPRRHTAGPAASPWTAAALASTTTAASDEAAAFLSPAAPASTMRAEAAKSRRWEELARLSHEGARMASEQTQPAWTVRQRPDQQAEAMLAEQREMDERVKLFRIMKEEGEASPMRKHIAKNIRSHLKEVSGTDTKDAMDVEHRCANIRKQLARMVNTRRELNNIRRAIPSMSIPTATGR